MQAIMESVFSIAYLLVVITLGCCIIYKNKDCRQYKLFGIMTLILGFGDAFHLVPRIIAHFTTGLENYTAALGFGKLVASITMTLFYVILYHIWKIRYNVNQQPSPEARTRKRAEGINPLNTNKIVLDISVCLLAVTRIVLCLLPQNRWFDIDAPLEWGVYRNVPFVILGIIMIIVYYQMARKKADSAFRFLWFAILLSFVFYIPVVLWADLYPAVGMFMLPKTCAYVWIVWMGFRGKGKDTGTNFL